MLYNWSGAAYRSKHVDVAPVEVAAATHLRIESGCGALHYFLDGERVFDLWKDEGFSSWEAMDEWFRPIIKPAQIVDKVLMRFSLLNV